MDRRQFTDAIKFFTLARHFYEDLGDSLVAEECTFAIALAQRVMTDAVRRNQPKKSEPKAELAPPINAEYDPAANDSISVA
jgi:hypothetical protein